MGAGMACGRCCKCCCIFAFCCCDWSAPWLQRRRIIVQPYQDHEVCVLFLHVLRIAAWEHTGNFGKGAPCSAALQDECVFGLQEAVNIHCRGLPRAQQLCKLPLIVGAGSAASLPAVWWCCGLLRLVVYHGRSRLTTCCEITYITITTMAASTHRAAIENGQRSCCIGAPCLQASTCHSARHRTTVHQILPVDHCQVF